MKQSNKFTPLQIKALALALLLSTLSFSVQSFAFDSRTKPKRPQTRAAYRAELDALMKEHKVACKISLDCEALPLGVKACGGPTEFIVISKATKMKMQDALNDLTKTINEMDTAANEGKMGTCEALEKPEVQCKSGTCAAAISAN